MKIIFAFAFLSATLACVYGFSQPIIRDTKQTGTFGGKTGDYCGFEDLKIWPGETINPIGRCAEYGCSDKFDIYVTPCPFDPFGQKKWINGDDSKEYPACCGVEVPV